MTGKFNGQGDIGRSRLRRFILIGLAGLATTIVSPTGASAGTLDQSQETVNSGFSGIGGNGAAAQTFTAGRSGSLDQVDVHIRRNCPDPPASGLTLEIRTTSGTTGQPSNTVLSTAPVSNVGTTPQFVSVPLTPDLPVTAGTRYAVVLRAPTALCDIAGTIPGFTWSGASPGPYANGAGFGSNDNTATWTVPLGNFDFAFRTFVADPPPPPGDTTPPPDDTTPPPDETTPPVDTTPPADTDPPETAITKGAPNRTEKTTIKFKFISDEPGSTFQCKSDKKPWKPCTSPRKVRGLDDGKHKFLVRATDAAGNVDTSAAKDKFEVEG